MFQYLKKLKGLFTLTIILSVITSMAVVGIAFLLQRILDAAVTGNMDDFTRVLIISIAYFLFLGLIIYLYSLSAGKFVCKVIYAIREKAFSGIIKRNYKNFYNVDTADYLSALTNDVKLVEENYILPLLEIIQSSVMFVSALIVIFYFDIIIALSLLGAILIMFIVPSIFGAILQKKQERFSKTLSEFTSNSKDILTGFEVIKSYSMVKYIISRFDKINKKTRDAQFGVEKVSAANQSASMVLAVFTQIFVIFLSAYFIIIGRTTVGTMVAMVQITGTLTQPLLMIFASAPRLKGVKDIIIRLNKFSNYNEETFTGTIKPTLNNKISAKNLTFSYDNKRKVLNDIYLEIKKGSKIALVGKNGCGKTTLVKLLCGYYSDYQGEIKYDNNELIKLDYDKLIKLSATIHQNVYIFNESIYDNICLHNEYSKKELEKALEISGVSNLKIPLDTMVEENGKNLSGGQKQRIAVARAIIQNKPMLILDEGTSAIDMQTAYDIESRLLDIKDLTLITITHNLHGDNLKRYDQIIYMDKGEINEVGTFEELIKKQGKFYNFTKTKKI